MTCFLLQKISNIFQSATALPKAENSFRAERLARSKAAIHWLAIKTILFCLDQQRTEDARALILTLAGTQTDAQNTEALR